MKYADLPRHLFQVLPTAFHRRTHRRPAFESFAATLLLSAFYVAPGGSDSANGSAQSPWATFQKAASTAVAGDTVHFASGTYNSPGQVDFHNNGTSASPITFISDVKWGAQFRWPSSQNANHVGLNVTGNYVTIQGFDVSATSNNTSMMIGIQVQGLHDSVIGNRVHDFVAGDVPAAGIADEYTSANQYTQIIGNWVYNIGTTHNGQSQGIYPQNYGDVVQNNVVYNCAAWGIQAYHACTNATISNNLVFGNKAGGILCEAAPSSDGNKTPAVYWDHSIVSNNIVINNGGYGISSSSGALVGSHNQYLNNFIHGNASGAFALNGNPAYTQTGNTTTNPNPGFVNYQPNGTGDYHLAFGSPCIDAGTSQGAPATDHDGVSRPRNAGFDIGPYEYVAP